MICLHNKKVVVAIYITLIFASLVGLDIRGLLSAALIFFGNMQWLGVADMAFALLVCVGLLAYIACFIGMLLKGCFSELERRQFKYIIVVGVGFLFLHIVPLMLLFGIYAHMLGLLLMFTHAFFLFVGLNAYLHNRYVAWTGLKNELFLAVRLR